jgi:hypothetical protein
MARRDRIAAVLVAGTVMCTIAGFLAYGFHSANQMAEYSAQMALFKEAELLLEEYRAQHGAYPKSLNSLDFRFPDGGDQSTLQLLHYESDGKTYSLITTDYSGREHRKSR